MPFLKDTNGHYIPTPSSQGADGREVSFRVTSSYIQWRYEDTEWENLISLATITGPHGAEVEMQITPDLLLQYKLESDSEWITLFDLSTLTRSVIFQGTTVTGEGTGISASVSGSKTGDMYLNVDTSNVYRASASNVWDYKGRLVAALSTEITGLLKGSNSVVTEAVAGVDFVAPFAPIALTLPTSGYSGTGPYTKSFTTTGVSADTNKRYLLMPTFSSAKSTRDNQKTAWNLIDFYEIPSDNTLVVTVSAVPSTEVPFSVIEEA